MRFITKKVIFSLICFLLFSTLEASLSYSVEYLGLDDSTALKTIRSVSQLTTLKKRPPDSINALRYRAESDIPEMLKVLHGHGYFEASVQIKIEEGFNQVLVLVQIHPGPAYQIHNVKLHFYEKSQEHPLSFAQISPEAIGLIPGKPMNAQKEISAELHILEILSQNGYPLASIVKRQIVADGETKTVSIEIDVDTGPYSKFGSSSIQGNTSVKPLFFAQKTEWKQGAYYNSSCVGETQKALMDTGLFSSVLITHGDTPNSGGELPMHFEVAESKHKSINAGVSYQTYYGPGVTFGWENRNISGLGRKLSLQGDVTKRSHTGIATYMIPNFYRIHQDYVWQAQAMHQAIIPYSERTYNLTNRVERRIGKKKRVSIGGKIERLLVTASAQNGNYWLLELPLYFGWSSANSLLNPTKGAAIEYIGCPTINTTESKELADNLYFSNIVKFSYYLPITKDHAFVIAQKITAGSILIRSEHRVPLSKRFFGGSEEELRGYAYQSVSPLTGDHKPYGGRSELFYTLETRFRLSQSIGLVPFFDMGSVYSATLPSFKGTWLKSVGVGLRYFSFMGPFRLDVGFPLNPRKHLDKQYRILVSVGQSF